MRKIGVRTNKSKELLILGHGQPKHNEFSMEYSWLIGAGSDNHFILLTQEFSNSNNIVQFLWDWQLNSLY